MYPQDQTGTTAYLDHNVVVGIGNNHIALDLKSFEEKGVRFVLSPSHWIEASRAPSLRAALRTADAMQSLRPLWLRERRSLERREVQAWLSGKANDNTAIEPLCNSTSLVATDLSGLSGAIAIITCTQIVRYLHNKGDFRNTLEGAYKSNADWFEVNVQHVAKGQLTAKKENEIWVAWICSIAREAGQALSDEQLKNVDRSCFPTTLTEFEVAKENWTRAVANPQMKLSPQRLGDVFHLVVALPYVDFVISNDSGFRSLAKAVRKRLPFRAAVPLACLSELADRI